MKKLAEELKKLSDVHVTSKQAMEQKVNKLTERLGVNVGDETTVAEVVKEETKKVE